ncbi:peptidoglycan-binding domain-containing protein [Bacillus velezensis]
MDGAYGAKTANTVIRFQLVNGLKADGIYALEPKQNLKCC